MLKLKLQYFASLIYEEPILIGRDLVMLGGWRTRKRGEQQRWLDEMRWDCCMASAGSMDMSLDKLWEIVGQENLVCCNPVGHKVLNREIGSTRRTRGGMCSEQTKSPFHRSIYYK